MISIIAPVYNEEENLTEFNQRIVSVLKSMDKKYEVIYVDDGSKDKSLGIIKEFKDKFDFVHYISLQRNFGQHAAIMAGLKLAEGDIIICTEKDGKYGRMLGWLYKSGQTISIQEDMINRGYGWSYDGGTKEKTFEELKELRQKDGSWIE